MGSKILLNIIKDAFSYRKLFTENHFHPKELAAQGDQLIKGIRQRNYLKDVEGRINLDMTLEEIKADPEAFTREIDDFIASKMKDKYSYALRFDHLIQYLNGVGETNLSNEFLKRYKYKDADRRRLAILKYLHEDAAGKNQREIAEQFGIDEKTYREDMNTLMDGFHFMGTTIKIDGNNKTKSVYSSPVHPLFLALNTTQVWSLIVGSKLLTESTFFGPDFTEIVDMIYTQLSPMARAIIDRDSEQYGFTLDEHDLQYKNSEVYYKAYVKNKISRKLCHLLRKGETCKIHYNDPESPDVKKLIVGTISIYIDDDLSLDQIKVNTETGSILVKISSIIEISELLQAE